MSSEESHHCLRPALALAVVATGATDAKVTCTAPLARAEAAQGAKRSTPWSSFRAPALSSGLLRLPHLGDCTQDGQPDSHSHWAIASRVAATHVRNMS